MKMCTDGIARTWYGAVHPSWCCAPVSEGGTRIGLLRAPKHFTHSPCGCRVARDRRGVVVPVVVVVLVVVLVVVIVLMAVQVVRLRPSS